LVHHTFVWVENIKSISLGYVSLLSLDACPATDGGKSQGEGDYILFTKA